MSIARPLAVENEALAIPTKMTAAVYRGVNDVRLEEVPVPEIGHGEILIRVHTCGICGTDLKKIATGSHSAPRIFGHETSGVVAKVGEGVRKFAVGERVVVFHHIPCRECYYCRDKTFAQCATYKKVGCTAGFEPSGGGFAEYVRVMDWIVEKGTVRIPDSVSFEQACFVEPVNTCIKGIETLRLQAGETVLVIGQGPIGLILANLAKRAGARVITSDLYPARLTMAHGFGLNLTIDASKADAGQTVPRMANSPTFPTADSARTTPLRSSTSWPKRRCAPSTWACSTGRTASITRAANSTSPPRPTKSSPGTIPPPARWIGSWAPVRIAPTCWQSGKT